MRKQNLFIFGLSFVAMVIGDAAIAQVYAASGGGVIVGNPRSARSGGSVVVGNPKISKSLRFGSHYHKRRI